MNSPDDVTRSVRRYVAWILGAPPWQVRLGRTPVADDARPVAVIDVGLMTTPFARRTVAQGDVQRQRTFTVVLYPALGASAPESAELARQAEVQLDAGISRGLVTSDTPPKSIGGPFVIPIWDYAGVPIVGAGRGATPAEPYSFAQVDQSYTIRPVQDAMDELRFTVVATLRMSWWQGGRIAPPAPIVTGLPATFIEGAPPVG